MCRMMDHEIKEGKLCLKENDLVLYENRDESKNLQSVVRLILLIVVVTIVIVILLRKLFGTQRRSLFKFVWICLFGFVSTVYIAIDRIDLHIFVELVMRVDLPHSILFCRIFQLCCWVWILINSILLYLSRMKWSQKTNSTFVKSFTKVYLESSFRT